MNDKIYFQLTNIHDGTLLTEEQINEYQHRGYNVVIRVIKSNSTNFWYSRFIGKYLLVEKRKSDYLICDLYDFSIVYSIDLNDAIVLQNLSGKEIETVDEGSLEFKLKRKFGVY